MLQPRSGGAAARLGAPLRVALPEHRGLDAILEDRAWVCVDSTRDDLPVLAWIGFANRRERLHDPVDCRLELYHCRAGLVTGTVLDALDRSLRERLSPPQERSADATGLADLAERRRLYPR